jgi:sugar-specific transcriptional regulator TrmB
MVSQERVLRILQGFGISKADAEVYVYLAKRGPTRSTDLAVDFGKTQPQIYPILRRLHKRGIVTHSKSRQVLFSALAFEELLERYVKLNMEQARIIEETKEQLLTSSKDRTDRDSK